MITLIQLKFLEKMLTDKYNIVLNVSNPNERNFSELEKHNVTMLSSFEYRTILELRETLLKLIDELEKQKGDCSCIAVYRISNSKDRILEQIMER